MIREISKGRYEVLDSTGSKVLGTHKSKEKALAQLKAIEASKAKKKESN